MGTPRQFFDSKASKRGVLQRLSEAVGLKGSVQSSDLEPSKPSAPAPDISSASSPATTSAAQPASIPVDAPANTPASGPYEFPPLEIVTYGRSAWVKGDTALSTPAEMARVFLRWVAETCPECAGKDINVPDIERHFVPRFKAAVDCPKLPLGTLLRGLTDLSDDGEIDKVEERYKDWRDGKRYSRTAYSVPRLRASVVKLADRRKRAG